MAKKQKFIVQDLSTGAAVFADRRHIVSTPTRVSADGISRLLSVAAEVDASAEQMVWALAKSLGVKINIG